MQYSIGEFAAMTDLSAPTLRYYEQESLIFVQRNAANRRFYTEEDVTWIAFIKKLKETGMKIKDIQKYAKLRYEGEATMQQRLDILEHHKELVVVEKEKWEQNLCQLNKKIQFYKAALGKK